MKRILEVKSHILRDHKLKGWENDIAGKWHYQDLIADKDWKDGWISFDAVTYDARNDSVYCGLNSINSDLLYQFNPGTNNFTNLKTNQWTDEFDVKIHRTLLLNHKDGCFYFATSLLHDIDNQRNAPGGKLVRYNPLIDQYDILSIPFPSLYIQSIAMDYEREIIYGFTYPAEFIFRFELNTGKTKILGYIGNSLMLAQPHNAVIDKDGWLWGTYAETRAWDEINSEQPVRLFKYHPDEDRFIWLPYGLSRKTTKEQLIPNPELSGQGMPDMTESRHKMDYGFCDSMIYDGDRYIYAGTVAGVLSRINIETNEVEKIANVMNSGRFPAMGFDSNGNLYGGGGMKGQTMLSCFDPKTFNLEVWNDLVDKTNGERPARIHELCIASDNKIYFGENDNHERSSYLWSAKIE